MKLHGKKFLILIVTIILSVLSLFLLFYNQASINIEIKNILAIYAFGLIILNFSLFFVLKGSLKQNSEVEYRIEYVEDDISNSYIDNSKNKNINNIKQFTNNNMNSSNISFKDNHLKNKINPLISNANILTESNKNINSLYSKIKELSKFNKNIKTYAQESASNFEKITKEDEELKKSFESIDSKTKEIASMVIELGNSINKLNGSIEKLNDIVFNISIDENNSDKDDFTSKISDLRNISKEVLTYSKEVSNIIYSVKYEIYNLAGINEQTYNIIDSKMNLNEDFIPSINNILGEVSSIMGNLLDFYKTIDTNLDIRNSLLEKARLIPNT